jgi:DNA processing protein
MQIETWQEQTIRWSMLHEPGDAAARAIFDARGKQVFADIQTPQVGQVWREFLPQEYHSEIPRILERIKLRLPTANPVAAIERGIRWNARPVFEDQAPRLFEMLSHLGSHRPYLLWVAGELSWLDGSQVSIVGTRRPSAEGLANASRLIRLLGAPVVSGGAVGIDAQAHREALELGLPTAAFMAGGIDRAYPQENWELFHEIVRSGGAMISELAPRTAPSRFRFLQRNRLIAAASAETYVVEAGLRSGSRNTAGHARNLGRNVYAMDSSRSPGCRSMIMSGLAMPFHLETPSLVEHNILRVRDAQREGRSTVAEIAAESGLSTNEVRAVLSKLN